MAFPYLLASLVPSVVHLLPSPGAWMETFRRFMAFPLFATVIWLVWVLGQQTGIDGASALLATLLATTFALWSISLVGKTRQIVGGLSLFLLALTIWVMGPVAVKASDASNTPTSHGIWQAWEPGKVEQLTSANQLVFVDFTAAWCVTCQYNKKTTLANETVLADLKAKNVALLRADWTRRDPAISAALSGLGRNGVPVYVFYKKGAVPQILSEVLGVDEIRAVIASL
jgi:thiol:disulfide interchange protein DsbD